ncbi:MAG: SUMF1/EgtB/PvdO family nonheme iron enzyme [Alphaproteobacteria bacterium]|nr:SUMF1/EgtB/PvdO family nonheme iron enzyme [Alphaproteobacteria bacterium]
MSLISHRGVWYPRPLAPLSQGGDGRVFKVETRDGGFVAIKLSRPGREDALERELAAHERLREERPDLTPHVAPLVDFGECEDGLFLVFPWYEHTLASWSRGRTLSERLNMLISLCDGVCRMQRTREGVSSDLVHRDIKPSNVFVIEEGGEQRAVLGDFGASKASRGGPDPTFNTGRFTEGFAPVDQALPRANVSADPSWDVFALAATVFAVLEGAPPSSITSNYGQLTLEGRELRRLAKAYDEQPRLDTWERLSTLSGLPFVALVDRDALAPLSAVELTSLETALRRQLEGTVPHAAELARWMGQELGEALRTALHPDPGHRDADARGLRSACERCAAMLERVQAGEEVLLTHGGRRHAGPAAFVVAVALGAGLVLLSQALLPLEREVVVSVEGAPTWGEMEVWIQLEGQEARRMEEVDGAYVLAGVALGAGDLELRGGIRGAEGWDRCTWKVTQPLTVPFGFTVHRTHTRVGMAPRCPTVEQDYRLVRVPAGQYRVGSPPDEPFRDDDEALRDVQLSRPYEVGAFEVSQALWRAVMNDGPLEERRWLNLKGDQKPCDSYLRLHLAGPDLPMLCVDWCDAVEFANALSAIERLEPAYVGAKNCRLGMDVAWNPDADGWRLPTEVEWEVAARAGSPAAFAGLSSGEAWEEVCAYANVNDETFAVSTPAAFQVESAACSDRFDGLAPVDALEPNLWGLHHATGNVSEWTWDWFSPTPRGRTDPHGPEQCEPFGPCKAEDDCCRVLRGGGFDDGLDIARVAHRFRGMPGQRILLSGVRLARNAPATPSNASTDLP